MPAIPPNELVRAISRAIEESGFTSQLVSPIRSHPRRFVVSGPNSPGSLSVYAWTLTFGGRPALGNEYRIQMTSVRSPLQVTEDGPTILIGFEPELNLFAGFDLVRHRTFTPGSSSVQIDVTVLREAERDGLSFHRKSNDEVAIGVRPDLFMAYATNAATLHRYGREAQVLRLLNQAVLRPISERQTDRLSSTRKRIVREISRLSRDAAFRRRVMFAYGDRCAVTRTQLRIVDAAHIVPVEVDGSSDEVRNGIALSPTYHRAFDLGLIYLTERLEMRIDERRLAVLRQADLMGGIDSFVRPLGPIFLPPDSEQHPSVAFIRRANAIRQISGT